MLKIRPKQMSNPRFSIFVLKLEKKLQKITKSRLKNFIEILLTNTIFLQSLRILKLKS